MVPIVIVGLRTNSLTDQTGGLYSKASGESVYTYLADETGSRQVNYMRESETFEFVFNVEITAEGYTDFLFNPTIPTN